VRICTTLLLNASQIHALEKRIGVKTTTLRVGKVENKNLPHPEANRVIISRNAQNNDLLLDYLQDNNRLAQEIIPGHIIARVSVEFLTSLVMTWD
jgi:hypothetical protein